MKIEENTPDRLVIRDRPRILAGFCWFMGALCLWAAPFDADLGGIGERVLVFGLGCGALYIAWRAFPFQTFTFDRPSGRFIHDIRRPMRSAQHTLPIADIDRAALRSTWSDSSRMEQVVLETRSGEHPLEWGFVGVPREPVAEAINTWLAGNPQPRP
ncbi:MAG: hypothetical protein HKN63_11705 [Rhodobacteraceae bacterium]|nr:hypothetical protein [Paracoccaceae bacterium]